MNIIPYPDRFVFFTGQGLGITGPKTAHTTETPESSSAQLTTTARMTSNKHITEHQALIPYKICTKLERSCEIQFKP